MSLTRVHETMTKGFGDGSGGDDLGAVTNTFTSDGEQTVFELSRDPVSEDNTQVYFSGVYQNKGNYTIVGRNITFSTAPPEGEVVEIMIIYSMVVSSEDEFVKKSGDTMTGDLTVDGDVLSKDLYLSGSIEIEEGTGNVGVGKDALNSNTGTQNTAVGHSALTTNTTASNNTAVGYNAGYTTSTGDSNTFVGEDAGYSNVGNRNTFVGRDAGRASNLSETQQNTFVGTFSGRYVTSGAKNTIIGAYDGNQGGLDIRASDNNIVLSDGDGNPRMHSIKDGGLYIGHTMPVTNGDGLRVDMKNGSTGYFGRFNWDGTFVGGIQLDNLGGVLFLSASDHRLKENVVELTNATERLKQIPVRRFNFISHPESTVDGFLAHEVQAVVPECTSGTKDAVDEDGNPEYQGIDQSKLVPLLVATIKELEARITALENT